MDLIAFLPLIIIMGVFLFVSSRRQRKLMQATIDLQESLRVGDRVLTTSGLEGSITALSDDTVDLEIAPGVVTTWVKLAVRERRQPTGSDAGELTGDDLAGLGPDRGQDPAKDLTRDLRND
jgi:preprotein translocase subunit YajC